MEFILNVVSMLQSYQKSMNLKNVNCIMCDNSCIQHTDIKLASATLSVNISIQKSHEMQFYLLNMSLLFLRMFGVVLVHNLLVFTKDHQVAENNVN